MNVNNIKVYLGIITQNDVKNISELTSDYQYFDGIFATDHESTDGTYEILDQRKGSGAIIRMPFMHRHDHSMNTFLFHPKFREGYWCLLRDGAERINSNFAKNIKNFIFQLEQNNINGVYQYSKLLLFKKFHDISFQSSPHWGCVNVRPNYIAIEQVHGFEDPKSYCYSLRNEIRPRGHWILHFLKYYFEYQGFSNHLLLGRENNHNEYKVHEEVRRKFINYCLDDLKIEATVTSLINYWKNNPLNYEMKWFLNFEKILSDSYCYCILNHSLDELESRKEAFKIE